MVRSIFPDLVHKADCRVPETPVYTHFFTQGAPSGFVESREGGIQSASREDQTGDCMNAMVKLGLLAAAVGLAVAACHVGGGYTVGGTVTGVRGSGLVIQDNSGNNFTVSGNGSLRLSSRLAPGG